MSKVSYQFLAHVYAVEAANPLFPASTPGLPRTIEIHAEVDDFFAKGGAKRLISRNNVSQFHLGSEIEEIRILKNIGFRRGIDRQSLFFQEIELKKLSLTLDFVVQAGISRSTYTMLFAATLHIKNAEIIAPIRRNKTQEVIEIGNFDLPEIEFL